MGGHTSVKKTLSQETGVESSSSGSWSQLRHGQSLSLLGFPMASKPAFTQAQHWGTNFQSASRTHGVRPSPPKLPLPLSSQPTPLHGAFSGRSRTRAVSSMHTHVTS